MQDVDMVPYSRLSLCALEMVHHKASSPCLVRCQVG